MENIFTQFTISTADNLSLSVNKFAFSENPNACLVIVHGMAEHAERYNDFAKFLSEKSFAVYTYDQRGHGKTAGKVENLGFFAESGGWNKVVDDLQKVIEQAKKDFPGKKVFVLGHSMGSFVTRSFLVNHSNEINGAVLSGTAGSAGALGKIGIGLAKIISAVFGKRSKSPLMDNMSFGSFNKGIKPVRTKFDWLSRDNTEVDKYIADPFCGTVFTAGFFYDMLRGLEFANNSAEAVKIRKDIPLYIFSGAKDPVSKNSSQIKSVEQMYKSAGISDITVKLYAEGRHEMLNETNKTEVYSDVVNWLNSKL